MVADFAARVAKLASESASSPAVTQLEKYPISSAIINQSPDTMEMGADDCFQHTQCKKDCSNMNKSIPETLESDEANAFNSGITMNKPYIFLRCSF